MVGCVQENSYTSVTPVIIAKGNLYGNSSNQVAKQSQVISTSAEWLQLQSQISTVNTLTNSYLENDVDFTQYTVLAIFDEIRYSGEYSIDINVFEDNKTVFVNVIYKAPSGGPVITVITQPYIIVKIPKTTKQVKFTS
jgi:hypothetical protein